ncbi:hypothetical protein CICLE_v10027626mg [Citrus x clementina]|uniref:Uncharacterized protein n=1 Tax=Citrus clementina TaxID=85681 RepID=V4RX98_CITCL|nr:hypothetical protein CICLE_v10027626mg [Citrus x clementina]
MKLFAFLKIIDQSVWNVAKMLLAEFSLKTLLIRWHVCLSMVKFMEILLSSAFCCLSLLILQQVDIKVHLSILLMYPIKVFHLDKVVALFHMLAI